MIFSPAQWIDRGARWMHRQGRRRAMRHIEAQVAETARLEPEIKMLTDDALRARFLGLRAAFADGPPLEKLPEAFALVREAVVRTKKIRPYDVQIMAGLVMARGQLAEMATGEGKTLVATLPACVLALAGKGVHVATVNAYLAQRDFDLMKCIFEFLGLTAIFLPEKVGPEKKREAYAADITYGTGYEFGFDYLRDQLALLNAPAPKLGRGLSGTLLGLPAVAGPVIAQRPLAYAVIDEIDSVLIDEAVTPLVISRPMPQGENPDAPVYVLADEVACGLKAQEHYELSGAGRRVTLTRAGLVRVYELRPRKTVQALRRAWHEYVEQALRARHVFECDVNYLVKKGAVEIIDENTGRSFPDRKWRGGLHQAVEAKEKVAVTHETESDVTISRQRFYKLYPFICGMSGTAGEEEGELLSVYGLRVFPIPRNRPIQRIDLPGRMFGTVRAKHEAIVAEAREMLKTGRPVLVGTRTVLRSEELAARLKDAGIPYVLLNARQDADEAAIVAQAGRGGRVTIATNMAGRGTDIKLGEGVEELGGLHVIAEERNESRRIDRQLAGRAGRQGDRGSSQFFMSYEDDLIVRSADEPPVAPEPGELAAHHAGLADVCQLRCERQQAERRAAVMHDDHRMAGLKKNL
jgi:preprotein translocase subunit SecA